MGVHFLSSLAQKQQVVKAPVIVNLNPYREKEGAVFCWSCGTMTPCANKAAAKSVRKCPCCFEKELEWIPKGAMHHVV